MNAKRIVTVVLSLILFTFLFFDSYTNARAQAASDNIVTFAAFGKQEILLDGPVDSTGIDFYLPADWSLTPGSKVHLNMRAFLGGSSAVDTNANASGYIDVYMNNTWLETIALTQNGDYSIDVNVPNTAWNLPDTRLPQTLSLALHDAVRCSLVWASAGKGTLQSISVSISPTSYLDLPHKNVAMPTDLRQLPYPLYQQSFRADKALVIVPDQPTEGELQAALIVEAAFARMTDGGLKTSFTTVGALNSTSLSGTHAIFIGNPSAFPQLDKATLPLKPSGGKFDDQQVKSEDGVLEFTPSPDDPTMVWLFVSGNNDAGIVKAAQAVGSGAIRPYGPSDLAIVTDVQASPALVSTITDTTLENLGYGEQKHSGYGIAYFYYYFDVPPTQAVTDGAYFEMIYNNSALLNFEESGISIIFNNQFAGSVRFNDRTTDATSAKFNIPASMFLPGKNSLLIEANLSGTTPCIPVDQIWVSVKANSLLHLPSLPVSNQAASSNYLASYPQLIFPTMDNLAFILTSDDPASWDVAASIAYDIGKNTRNPVLQPSVAFANAIPNGILGEKSQIIIGRPSAIPLLQELSPYLPAPFAAGTDIATEPSDFKFNVPATVPVGYLQILPSPSNSKQLVLTVLGNNDQGLRSAGSALSDSTLRSQMTGNLAVVTNNQVIVDQVDRASAAAVTPVVQLQSTPAAANSTQTGPFNIKIINIGLGILAILFILGLVALLVNPKKKNP